MCMPPQHSSDHFYLDNCLRFPKQKNVIRLIPRFAQVISYPSWSIRLLSSLKDQAGFLKVFTCEDAMSSFEPVSAASMHVLLLWVTETPKESILTKSSQFAIPSTLRSIQQTLQKSPIIYLVIALLNTGTAMPIMTTPNPIKTANSVVI